MTERVERVTEVVNNRAAVPTGTAVREVSEARITGAALVARIVWFIAGVLLVLLAFRFVLALLGANQNNGFANFIYTTSHPFVTPFFSLFSYNYRYGVSRFESFTLVAMAVYALIAFGISRLLTLTSPNRDVV